MPWVESMKEGFFDPEAFHLIGRVLKPQGAVHMGMFVLNIGRKHSTQRALGADQLCSSQAEQLTQLTNVPPATLLPTSRPLP